MIVIRKSDDRFHADLGWLKSRHTFSFADFHDPQHVHFRWLRVINEDWFQPGRGFGMHPHADMEIITYIISGALEHRDNMGNGSVIRRGDVQKMTAGTGVQHSEVVPEDAGDVTHLLQIWLFPQEKGLTPGYWEGKFTDEMKRDRLCLLVSPDEAGGSLKIYQDARLFASILSKGKSLEYPLSSNRYGWLQLISGELELNGEKLSPGDGTAVTDTDDLEIAATTEAEFLLFDMG